MEIINQNSSVTNVVYHVNVAMVAVKASIRGG